MLSHNIWTPKYSFRGERIFQTLPVILGPPLKDLFPHVRLLGLNVLAPRYRFEPFLELFELLLVPFEAFLGHFEMFLTYA